MIPVVHSLEEAKAHFDVLGGQVMCMRLDGEQLACGTLTEAKIFFG